MGIMRVLGIFIMVIVSSMVTAVEVNIVNDDEYDIEADGLFQNVTVDIKDFKKALDESSQVLTKAEKDLKEGKRVVDDIYADIDKAKDMHEKRLSVFVSWLMANSACEGEEAEMEEIKHLWKHARKITDDIEECEERLDKLEAEKMAELGKLEHLENIYKEAKEAHEKNSKTLKQLQASGCNCCRNIGMMKSFVFLSVIFFHL